MRTTTKSFVLFLFYILILQETLLSQATCATAVTLTSGPNYSNTGGTLLGANATAAGSLPAALCGNASSADVWYRFVAQSQFPSVTLSSVGAQLSAASPRIQILSLLCTSAATVFACSNTLSATPSSGLTLGTSYYVRITTNTNTGVPAAGDWAFNICVTDPPVVGSRMKEVFKETTLHGTLDATLGSPYPAGNMYNPWEITYGPDGFLWITEARGYRVRRMDPSTGTTSTVLFLSNGASGYLTPGEHTTYNCLFDSTFAPWPQGGMMGLALHPDFMHPTAPKKYVYLGYVHKYDSVSATTNGGHFFKTKLVRFTYNPGLNKLESPVSLCDTIKGSNDHNSGRMIIAPVGGVNYLFYSVGDLGSGNYLNKQRVNRSQNPNFYEGKILRFNVDPDGDADAFDRWIPDSTGVHNNPFNGVKQSAVYTTGVRNNQGFAYNPFTNKLYGAEHGQFSDDEINIIEAGKNYGHPLVEGYNDGNYNNAKAGSSSGTMPFITSEAANATAIGANFRQPIYTFFPAPNGPAGTANTILNIYGSTTGDPGGNNTWHSVAHSGMDMYTSSFIPGWRNSLMTAAMKKAKFFRMKLYDNGDSVRSTPAGTAHLTNDTVGLFFGQNRYRDLAISTDGKSIFVSIDKDATTSGPTAASPQGSLCPGCIKKFEFLGYNDNAGVSTIPTSIPVAPGVSDANTNGTITVINADNNNIWVPITDSLGNIIAEIDANGNNLDTIRSTVFIKSGTHRLTIGGKPYLNRSLTIMPKNQPSSDVNIRLYITAAELAALVAAPSSGVSGINNINIFKNNDGNSTGVVNPTTNITPLSRTAFDTGYVIKASITSFSSFYFASSAFTTLPVNLLTFTGKYINKATHLKWETQNEINTSGFIVERSIGGSSFEKIGIVDARGNTTGLSKYSYNDNDASLYSPATLHYRLKMVDADGAYKYSSVVVINLDYITGIVTIIPNPVVQGGEIRVNMTSPLDGKVNWKLIDNNGRTVLQSSTQVKKGKNNMLINVDRLEKGMYYMVVNGAGIDQKVKLQKL